MTDATSSPRLTWRDAISLGPSAIAILSSYAVFLSATYQATYYFSVSSGYAIEKLSLSDLVDHSTFAVVVCGSIAIAGVQTLLSHILIEWVRGRLPKKINFLFGRMWIAANSAVFVAIWICFFWFLHKYNPSPIITGLALLASFSGGYSLLVMSLPSLLRDRKTARVAQISAIIIASFVGTIAVANTLGKIDATCPGLIEIKTDAAQLVHGQLIADLNKGFLLRGKSGSLVTFIPTTTVKSYSLQMCDYDALLDKAVQ